MRRMRRASAEIGMSIISCLLVLDITAPTGAAKRTSTWPGATCWPGLTSTSATTAEAVPARLCSSFIDSITTAVSPAASAWPATAATLHHAAVERRTQFRGARAGTCARSGQQRDIVQPPVHRAGLQVPALAAHVQPRCTRCITPSCTHCTAPSGMAVNCNCRALAQRRQRHRRRAAPASGPHPAPARPAPWWFRDAAGAPGAGTNRANPGQPDFESKRPLAHTGPAQAALFSIAHRAPHRPRRPGRRSALAPRGTADAPGTRPERRDWSAGPAARCAPAPAPARRWRPRAWRRATMSLPSMAS